MKSIDSIRSLTYRPYRRLFIGSAISNVGTWIETVTIGVYMQTATQKAVLVAATMAVGFIPQAFMGFFSGAIADRFNRKKVLMFNNSASGLLAGTLAFCVAKNIAHPVLILSILFVAGMLNATSFPTWQALLYDIVPKDKVAGALALMSAQWNLGRILGPAFAAVLISGGHYSVALSVNALSFLVVIAMLGLIQKKDHQPYSSIYKKETSNDMSILGGWKFIFSKQSNLIKSFVAMSITILWASPFISLIPNVADEVFHSKNIGTSLLITAQGIGAVAISVFITTFHARYSPPKTQLIFLFSLPLVLITYGLSPNLILGGVVTLLFGFTYMGTINGTMLIGQLACPGYLKGRVASVYLSAIGIIYPISSVIQGYFVEKFNARSVFIFAGIALFLSLSILGFYTGKYRVPKPFDEQETSGTHNIIESIGTPDLGDI